MYNPQQVNYYPRNAAVAPMPMQPQPMEQQFYGLKGRPVSSFDEAKAAQIDFDGSIFIFPDFANKRVYTKQINLDGTLGFNTYELIETPQNVMPNYITREEFDTAIASLRKEAMGNPIAPTAAPVQNNF